MRLWEGLSQDLNFNVMMSQRGQLNLGHSDAQMTVLKKRGNTMRANGIDADILTREEVRRIAPYFDYSPNARFPIQGALWQDRAGIAARCRCMGLRAGRRQSWCRLDPEL